MNVAMDDEVYAKMKDLHGVSNNILNNDDFNKVLNYHSAFRDIPAHYKPAGVCIDKIVKLMRKYNEEDYEEVSEEEDSEEDSEEDDEVKNDDIGDNNKVDEEVVKRNNNEEATADNNVIIDYNNAEDAKDDNDNFISFSDGKIIDKMHYKKKITRQQLAIIKLIKEAVRMEKCANVMRHVVCITDNVFGFPRCNTDNNGCSLTIQTATAEAVENKVEKESKKIKLEVSQEATTTASTTVITVDHTSTNHANSGNLAKQLWEMAPIKEGAYGDIRQQKTIVDPTVRNARDYVYTDNHFSCSAPLLTMLASKWSDNIYPRQSDHVTVVPYKINCYDAHGCFATHVDTPDIDMIGTILLGLGQTEIDNTDGGVTTVSSHLHFNDNDNDNEQTWDPRFGHVCMFYSDVPHTVVANGRYRATVAFKVFSNHRVENICKDVTEDILKLARETLPKQPIGFLLSREYTHDSTAMKGIDGIFSEVVHQSGLYEEIKLVSVLVKTCKAFYYQADEPYESLHSNVYIITNDRIEKCCGVKKEHEYIPNEIDAIRNIDFYRVADGYKWLLYKVDEAYLTGNEAGNGEINSVYLHKALIAYPKK